MKNYIEEAKEFSNRRLHEELKRECSTERKIMAKIICYIAEVDRRKLYFDFNCTSLFGYLVKEMKYSNAAAQRRIDAARLLHEVPQLKSELESGDLNLSQVSVVAMGLKQAKKEAKQSSAKGQQPKVDAGAMKRNLIEKVKSQSTAEAQKLVAQTLNLEIQTYEKKVFQRDESVRLEFTLSKEEAELLKEVKDLLSHTSPGASAKEIFVAGLRELKKKKDPTLKGLRRANTSESEVTAHKSSSGNSTNQNAPAKAVSLSSRNIVFTKQNCCQWKFDNGQTCGSTFQLQIDHIKSKWLGGKDEIENYQVLCSAHNKLKYRQEIGLN